MLIGTPTSGAAGGQIEQILIQLRSRQIADEQVETYERQESAAVKERELREAEAKAKQQTALTESEHLHRRAEQRRARPSTPAPSSRPPRSRPWPRAEAEKVRLMGEGEAKRIKVMAEAEAEQAARVGIAQAMAIEEQVRAYGGPQFQLVQQVMNRFAEAIERSQVDVVPKINMAGQGGGGNLIESLLGVLLSEKVGEMVGVAPTPPGPRRPDAAQTTCWASWGGRKLKIDWGGPPRQPSQHQGTCPLRRGGGPWRPFRRFHGPAGPSRSRPA